MLNLLCLEISSQGGNILPEIMFENENLKTRILVTENTRVVRENYHLKQLNSGLERKLFALRYNFIMDIKLYSLSRFGKVYYL